MLFLHILSKKLKHEEGTNNRWATAISSTLAPSSSLGTEAYARKCQNGVTSILKAPCPGFSMVCQEEEEAAVCDCLSRALASQLRWLIVLALQLLWIWVLVFGDFWAF